MKNLEEKLAVDPDLLKPILVNFLKQEAYKFGFRRGIVGLSGGLDSSLVCYLAKEAYGRENVLALILPYKTSHPDSETDALFWAETLGIHHRKIDITSTVDPLLAQIPAMDNKRKGNVMARMRMIILYDQSADFGGLVIGTSNKTEMLLGYTTLFGDMASAINPLGDLYKTQIWQLARAWGLPEKIRNKVPTADLWPGQTDEGELGLTYALADQILYLLVDERYRPEEIVALGFDKATVERIVLMMQNSQFKRLPPIVAKVSRRSIGHDFLYERDWGR